MRKTTQSIILSLLSVLLVTALPVKAGNVGGVGSANVKFGNPTGDNSNDCTGKGVCMLSSKMGITTVEIPVSFTYVPELSGEGFNTLSFQFSISALKTVDEQYLYENFLYPDGQPRENYTFDANYTFYDRDLCLALGVNPGELTIHPCDASTIENVFDTDVRVTFRIPTGK